MGSTITIPIAPQRGRMKFEAQEIHLFLRHLRCAMQEGYVFPTALLWAIFLSSFGAEGGFVLTFLAKTTQEQRQAFHQDQQPQQS